MQIRADPAQLVSGVHRGRSIENGLHWILDVAFREDESRTRDANAGANWAMLRRVAVALLKNAEVRGSIKTKQLMAGWDDQLLLKILQGITGD
jgi:predicted transposase YbfD/YdcC